MWHVACFAVSLSRGSQTFATLSCSMLCNNVIHLVKTYVTIVNNTVGNGGVHGVHHGFMGCIMGSWGASWIMDSWGASWVHLEIGLSEAG